MFADARQGRHIFLQLVKRDFRLRIEGTFFGLFWSLSQPLLWLLLFSFLRSASVFEAGNTRVPYPVYAFVGIIHWQLFVGILTRGSSALIDASSLVSKVKLPRESLVLARCVSALVDWVFALPVLAAIMAWHHIAPAPTVMLLPLAVLPLVLLATALALISAVVALPFRDLLNLIGLVLTPLMFLSSVLYATPQTSGWTFANQLNPMISWLALARTAIYDAALPNPRTCIFWCAAPVALFLISWRLFFLIMPKVAEHA